MLGLLTFDESTILVFIEITQARSAWPSFRGNVPQILEMVSATAGEEMVNPATKTAGILVYWFKALAVKLSQPSSRHGCMLA